MKKLSEIFGDVPVICVAEIGINHNGNVDLAKKMITAAAKSGAHAAKIQSIDASELYSTYSKSISNGDKKYNKDESIIDFFKKFYLNEEEHRLLFKHARSENIELFSTPFDNDTVDMLEDCGASLYKIASCDVTNHKLIKHISSKRKPIILSTGMSSDNQIKQAVRIIKSAGNDFILLHCVSLYPVEPINMNLRRIDVLKSMHKCKVGLSDHSNEEVVLAGAVFKGISMVERHFTDEYRDDCPDKEVSYDSQKFRSMVDNIGYLLEIDGCGNDLISTDEKAVAKASRRSLFISTDLKKGTVLTGDMLKCKRPFAGICASLYYDVIGKKLTKNISSDMPLYPEDIE
ncbi:MAG TPA: N-acetylneuraminate synthase family protein [Spirochaetota bacterium]|nr:N-acetylneuraminate synthase family protein [Spirochaetota bacterium]